MTLDEFIAALEKTPRDWYVESDGSIRTRTMTCPVCAVSNKVAGTRLFLLWNSAAFAMGLGYEVAFAVAHAADDDRDHDPELRARLLKACGLAP